MPKEKALLLWLVLLFVVTAIVQGMALIRHGFSARDAPSALETYVARTTRKLAVPSDARNQKNPFTATPEVLAEARAHFADHCAICHGNDGSGKTEIGQNLYPKAPDMRLSQTQGLTDGESGKSESAEKTRAECRVSIPDQREQAKACSLFVCLVAL